MKLFRVEKAAYCILSVIASVIGVYLMINPNHSFSAICHLVGAVLIIYGIIKLLGYFTDDMYNLAFQFDLAMGIFSCVLGFMLLFHSEYIMKLLPTFVGVLILIDGVFKIQTSIDAKRFGLTKWWLILVFAIIAVAAGIILVIRPISATLFVMRLIGLNLLIDGGMNLIVVLYTVKERNIKNIN